MRRSCEPNLASVPATPCTVYIDVLTIYMRRHVRSQHVCLGLHAAYGGRSRHLPGAGLMVPMAALCASAVGLVPCACRVFMCGTSTGTSVCRSNTLSIYHACSQGVVPGWVLEAPLHRRSLFGWHGATVPTPLRALPALPQALSAYGMLGIHVLGPLGSTASVRARAGRRRRGDGPILFRCKSHDDVCAVLYILYTL